MNLKGLDGHTLLQRFDDSFGQLKRRKEILSHIIMNRMEHVFDPIIIRLIKACQWYIHRMKCPVEFLDAVCAIVCENNRIDTFMRSNGLQIILSVLLLNPIKNTGQVVKALGIIRHIIHNNSFSTKILYYNRVTNIICKLCFRTIHPDILSLSKDILIALISDSMFYDSTISSLPETHQFHGIMSVLQVVYLFLSGVHVEVLMVGLEVLKSLQVKKLLLPFDVPPMTSSDLIMEWENLDAGDKDRSHKITENRENFSRQSNNASKNNSCLKVDTSVAHTPAKEAKEVKEMKETPSANRDIGASQSSSSMKTPIHFAPSAAHAATKPANKERDKPFNMHNLNKYLIPNFDDEDGGDYKNLLQPPAVDDFGFTDFDSEPVMCSLTQWYIGTISTVTDVEVFTASLSESEISSPLDPTARDATSRNSLNFPSAEDLSMFGSADNSVVNSVGESDGGPFRDHRSSTAQSKGTRTGMRGKSQNGGSSSGKSFIECIGAHIVRMIISASMTESKVLQLINRNLVMMSAVKDGDQVQKKVLGDKLKYFRLFLRNLIQIKFDLKEFLFTYSTCVVSDNINSTNNNSINPGGDEEYNSLDDYLQASQPATSGHTLQGHKDDEVRKINYKTDIYGSIMSLFVMAYTTNNEKVLNVTKLYLYQSYLQDLDRVKAPQKKKEKSGGDGGDKHSSSTSIYTIDNSSTASDSSSLYFAIDCDDKGDPSTFEVADYNSEKIQFTVTFICDLFNRIFRMIFTNLRIVDVSFSDEMLANSNSIFNVNVLAAYRSYRRILEPEYNPNSSTDSQSLVEEVHATSGEHKDIEVELHRTPRSSTSSLKPKKNSSVKDRGVDQFTKDEMVKEAAKHVAIFEWFHRTCELISRECDDMFHLNLKRTHANRVLSLTTRSDVDIIFDMFRGAKVHYHLMMLMLVQVNKCKLTLLRLKEAQAIKDMNGTTSKGLNYFSCTNLFELVIYCKLAKNNVFERSKASANAAAEADFASATERLHCEVETFDLVISMLLQLSTSNYDIHMDISNIVIESFSQAQRSFKLTHRDAKTPKSLDKLLNSFDSERNSSSPTHERPNTADVFDYINVEDGRYLDLVASLGRLNIFELAKIEEHKAKRSSFTSKTVVSPDKNDKNDKKNRLKKLNSDNFNPTSMDRSNSSDNGGDDKALEVEAVKMLGDKLKHVLGVRDLSLSVPDTLMGSMNIVVSKVLVNNNSKNANAISNHSNYYFDVGTVIDIKTPVKKTPGTGQRMTGDSSSDDGEKSEKFEIPPLRLETSREVELQKKLAGRMERKIKQLSGKVKEEIKSFLSTNNVVDRFTSLVQSNKLSYNFNSSDNNSSNRNDLVHNIYLEYKALMDLIYEMNRDTSQNMSPNVSPGRGFGRSSPSKLPVENDPDRKIKRVNSQEELVKQERRQKEKAHREYLLSMLTGAAPKDATEKEKNLFEEAEGAPGTNPTSKSAAPIYDGSPRLGFSPRPSIIPLIKDSLLTDSRGRSSVLIKGTGGYSLYVGRQVQAKLKISQPVKTSANATTNTVTTKNMALDALIPSTSLLGAGNLWQGNVPPPSPKPLNLQKPPPSGIAAQHLDVMSQLIKHPLSVDVKAPNYDKLEAAFAADSLMMGNTPQLLFTPTKPDSIKPSSRRGNKYL